MNSRYHVTTYDPRYQVIVGWDDPFSTFFCEVFDTWELDEEHDPVCVLWRGIPLYEEVKTVDALQGHIRPFATIPEDLRVQLDDDQRQAPPPAPLQERAVWLWIPDDVVIEDMHGQFLRRMSDGILAQLFHPALAVTAAERLLIPATDVPRQCWPNPEFPGDWMTVGNIVKRFDLAPHCSSGPDEVFKEQLLRGIERHTAAWPTIWREAARVCCLQRFGIDFTDLEHLQKLRDAAHEASMCPF